MEMDRLSNLPSGILEIILSSLPLKEAVRTSVLSSRWRYQAAMLQQLVFDLNCCSSAYRHTPFVGIVDHVLSAHIGPIHKVEVFQEYLASEDLDRWILHLSRNSIKEFILRHLGKRYTVPSCLFSCQDVTSLDLTTCSVEEPPSSFKGFRSLKSLRFEDVKITQDVFEHLIKSCPLLESFTLMYCESFSHLLIDAPNLKFLYVRGSFKDVLLVNTPNLVDVSIGLDDYEFYVSQRGVPEKSSKLDKIISSLSQVQKLDFFCFSLMYLATGAVPVELPKPFQYLTCLGITLSLTNLEESLTALCLLRSCPVLQELEVQVFPGERVVGKGNSWLDDSRRCSLSQLRSVFINDIRNVKAELDFIRYLLLNSPVLERITVQIFPGVESSKLEKKFLRSRRASAHAKLIFESQ